MPNISKVKLPGELSIYKINSYRTFGIFYGLVDATSTATVFTATLPELTATEYYDGLTVMLKNGVITSASGFTLNVNNLGAKRVYSNMAAATYETTAYNINYTIIFVYDSTRGAEGGWLYYRGYYSDANSTGYQLRTNSTIRTASDRSRYYKVFFSSPDATQWIPASSDWVNNATTIKPINPRPFDPFGPIVYTSASTNYPEGSNIAATTIWEQYNLTLGYSFNTTGAALTLLVSKPVYIKATPLTNGTAVLDDTNPIVQALPSTEDGKIYIYFGMATSETAVEMHAGHPIYYYKQGSIRIWTNAESGLPPVTSSDNDKLLTVVEGEWAPAAKPTYTASEVGALSDDTTYVSSVNGESGEVTLDIPSTTSELTNNGASGESPFVEEDDLAAVAFSGDYSDLINIPGSVHVIDYVKHPADENHEEPWYTCDHTYNLIQALDAENTAILCVYHDSTDTSTGFLSYDYENDVYLSTFYFYGGAVVEEGEDDWSGETTRKKIITHNAEDNISLSYSVVLESFVVTYTQTWDSELQQYNPIQCDRGNKAIIQAQELGKDIYVLFNRDNPDYQDVGDIQYLLSSSNTWFTLASLFGGVIITTFIDDTGSTMSDQSITWNTKLGYLIDTLTNIEGEGNVRLITYETHSLGSGDVDLTDISKLQVMKYSIEPLVYHGTTFTMDGATFVRVDERGFDFNNFTVAAAMINKNTGELISFIDLEIELEPTYQLAYMAQIDLQQSPYGDLGVIHLGFVPNYEDLPLTGLVQTNIQGLYFYYTGDINNLSSFRLELYLLGKSLKELDMYELSSNSVQNQIYCWAQVLHNMSSAISTNEDPPLSLSGYRFIKISDKRIPKECLSTLRFLPVSEDHLAIDQFYDSSGIQMMNVCTVIDKEGDNYSWGVPAIEPGDSPTLLFAVDERGTWFNTNVVVPNFIFIWEELNTNYPLIIDCNVSLIHETVSSLFIATADADESFSLSITGLPVVPSALSFDSLQRIMNKQQVFFKLYDGVDTFMFPMQCSVFSDATDKLIVGSLPISVNGKTSNVAMIIGNVTYTNLWSWTLSAVTDTHTYEVSLSNGSPVYTFTYDNIRNDISKYSASTEIKLNQFVNTTILLHLEVSQGDITMLSLPLTAIDEVPNTTYKLTFSTIVNNLIALIDVCKDPSTDATTVTLSDLNFNTFAPLASPTFTGVPAAPTAATGTNTTQLATTAFVLLELDTLATVASTGSYNDLTDKLTAGTTASAVGTTASGGSATSYSKSDHVHNITSLTITSALNYTPEDNSNKVSAWSQTPTDEHYPTEKLVKDELYNKLNVINANNKLPYEYLSGTPTIPAALVNSDWNASSGVAQILNKPNIPNMPTSAIGGTTTPIYWDGTQFVATSLNNADTTSY